LQKVFPNAEFKNWGRCQRLLPHAQACASLIDKWDFAFPEAARLLNEAAYYLYERALFAEAEPLYQRALAIREKEFGPEHPAVTTSLNNLAELYRSQGRHAEAEPLIISCHPSALREFDNRVSESGDEDTLGVGSFILKIRLARLILTSVGRANGY
jgi:tetratricopeptide (TPR) repeat protein